MIQKSKKRIFFDFCPEFSQNNDLFMTKQQKQKGIFVMEKKKNSKQIRIRCNLIGFIVLFIFLLLFRDFLAAAAILAGGIYLFMRYRASIYRFFRECFRNFSNSGNYK